MSTLKKFVKEYNGAPYEIKEVAEQAAKVTNCPTLSKAASAYLEALETFSNELEAQGVEMG